MGRDGGVMIRGFIPSADLLPRMTFPGDIDLLVIPYEGEDLIVSSALAIELKAVRPTFQKQGKSPGDFGFSQAAGMLQHGFPYVAVGHLIVSDASPEYAWRKVLQTKIIDAAAGTVEEPWETAVDMMPADLIKRSFGRLQANCRFPELGLLASYVSESGSWFPQGKQATFNGLVSADTMLAIAHYYEQHVDSFLDTPKYPPRLA